MSLQYICDACNRIPAEYKIQEKARVKKKVFGWEGDSWTVTYKICEDCWEEIIKKVRKK